MRRGSFEILRRGLDNTIANWPLIALSLGETLLFGFIAVATALAIFVPIFVSAGIHLSDLDTPESVAGLFLLLAQRWTMIFWILLIVTVLLLLFIALHSFVEAGKARVYLAGDRVAGLSVDGPRSRYEAMSMAEWIRGGAEGWWPLFWIYNLAWGLAGIIVLLPLLPTLVLVLVLHEQPVLAFGAGCIGLAFTLLLGLVIGVVTAIWTKRAICEWALRPLDARGALAEAWAALRADTGRHLAVAVAMIVVGLAGSMFFASFSFVASFGDAFGDGSPLVLLTLPLRIGSSVISSIFSAAVSSWYLASYVALTREGAGGGGRGTLNTEH